MITTVQQTVRRINDESFENSLIKAEKYFIDSSISKYLKGVNPVFNFDSQLNSDTFAYKIDKYMTACLKNNYGKFFV